MTDVMLIVFAESDDDGEVMIRIQTGSSKQELTERMARYLEEVGSYRVDTENLTPDNLMERVNEAGGCASLDYVTIYEKGHIGYGMVS